MTRRTFNRYGTTLRPSATLERIAEILSGERCENCDAQTQTTKVGERYVCAPCRTAAEDEALAPDITAPPSED